MAVYEPLRIPVPTDDTEVGKHNLDELGVTIHPGFLPPAQVRALRERLEEQAEMERELGLASFAYDDSGRNIVDSYSDIHIGKPVGLPRLQRVHFLVNKGRVFIDFACHPVAREYAEHLFRGQRFNVGSQLGLILRNGVPAQPLHVDQLQVPFQTPFPMAINVKVALSEFTEVMGSTRFAPGTHRQAPPDPDHPPQVQTLPIEMRPGDAAIWDGRVLHGQGPSASDTVRYSVMTLYTVCFLKPPEFFPAIIHDHIYETLDADTLALYGFNYHVGGRIGPRHPADRRVNPNNPMPYVTELHRRGVQEVTV